MDGPERDAETGRYKPTVSNKDVLAAVREHTPAATTEVADAVGLARQNADYRLRRLEAAGAVRSKKVGPSLVWMIDDEEENDTESEASA